ncbi:MAG TPA: hypothetical protein VFU00_05320 [Gemmatimonadales bacterium]|nr:hypothetical protein [Gemmatimonadales bacterium]
MRASRYLCLLPCLAGAPLAAQATSDQARLVFNVNIGYVPGVSGWRVAGQPLFDDRSDPVLIDSLTLSRRIRSALSFGAQAIYYPGEHFGWLGEAQLIGLGFEDSCTVTAGSGSTRNTAICSGIAGSQSSGTAVLIGGGMIYRMLSQKTVSPYARIGLGAVISTQSSIRTFGTFPGQTGEAVEVEIYPDESTTRVTLGATLGAGFTAAIGRGYQLRWEVTDRIVGVRGVTAPTVQDGAAPPTSLRYRHLFGVQVGFDVLLERKRGRRY